MNGFSILPLRKLESPSPKDALCQVWLKMAVLEVKIFKFCRCFFAIISPCKREWFFIWAQGCFVPSLVETGLMVLEKKIKMWKVYNNDNDDDGQRKKLTWAFGSGKLKSTRNVKYLMGKRVVFLACLKMRLHLSILSCTQAWHVPAQRPPSISGTFSVFHRQCLCLHMSKLFSWDL